MRLLIITKQHTITQGWWGWRTTLKIWSTTHQKAHEVKCKDSRHSTKWQALEHCAGNSGGVTKLPGVVTRWLRRAALRVRASLCSPDSHYQYQDSVHHCSMSTACKEEKDMKKVLQGWQISLYYLQDVITLILRNRWDCLTGQTSGCFAVVSLGGHVIERKKNKTNNPLMFAFHCNISIEMKSKTPDNQLNYSITSFPFKRWPSQP